MHYNIFKMRGFIFKAIIITFVLIVGFEFTVGKRIDPIVENLNKFNNEQGRKDLKDKLRKEMRKGIEKEYILKEEDRILVYKFFNKLMSEINEAEKN